MFGLGFSSALSAALEEAPRLARSAAHNVVAPEHLLRAMMRGEGCATRSVLTGLARCDLFDAWDATWPAGLHPPRTAPALGVLAAACLEHAGGAARLREKSLVTTDDLAGVLFALDDPGMREFLGRAGFEADGFTTARERLAGAEADCLDACFLASVARPAPGAVGGVLERRLALPFALRHRDGPIARIVRTAARRAAGNVVDTVDLLAVLGEIDPAHAHHIEPMLAHALSAGGRETGGVPADVEGESLWLTTPAAYALGVALMLGDCYQFPYVRHEHLVAGLLLTREGRVRRAFENVLLTGLTTTRSHIETVAAHAYADLPAVLRSIGLELTSVLPPTQGDPLVSLGDERWEIRDADPLAVLDHLHRALAADDERAGCLDVALDRATQALGDGEDDLGFRTVALQGLWLGSLVQGDRGAAAAITRRLHTLAEADGWADRRDLLADWLPRRRSLTPAACGASHDVEEIASRLLAAAHPEQVLGVLTMSRVASTAELLAAVRGLRERGDVRVSALGGRGLVDYLVVLAAEEGLTRARSAVRSKRLAGRVSAAIHDEPSAAAFMGLVEDSIARSGTEPALDLLRELASAPAPVDVSSFRTQLSGLAVGAAHAMGSDRESGYLAQLAAVHNLLASTSAVEQERDAANELSRHAAALLTVSELCSSAKLDLPRRIAVGWWRVAMESHLESECGLDFGRLAVRIAAATLPRRQDLAATLAAFAGNADEVTHRWVRRIGKTLGITLPDVPASHGIVIRNEDADAAELREIIAAQRAALAEVSEHASAEVIERLVAANEGLIRVGRLGDIDAVRVLSASLTAVQHGFRIDRVRLVPVASRLHRALCAVVDRRVTEPGGDWALVVDAWAGIARIVDESELEVRRRNFGLVARGYERSRSHQERAARRANLEVAADALSRALLECGDPAGAAAVIEEASDLQALDHRNRWKPQPAAERYRVGPPEAVMEGIGYTSPYSFLTFMVDPGPRGTGEIEARVEAWCTGAATATPRPVPRPVLVVVPGRHGGHVLAHDAAGYTGWPAPGLDQSLAQRLMRRVVGEGEYANAVADLRAALPAAALAWVAAQSETAVVGRAWATLFPLPAALSGEERGGPVLSGAFSVAHLRETVDAVSARVEPPSRALVITDPQPSTAAGSWFSGAEYAALSAAMDSVTVLRGPEAVHGAMIEAIKTGPDVLHFGGRAHHVGLLLAYDTALTTSEVRFLPVGPGRAAVLAGGPTAFPTSPQDLESMADAFAMIGCPAVVACFWETDDLADSLLIDAFYRDATSTGWASPPASLQRAVTWLRTASWAQCAARLTQLHGEHRHIRPPDEPLPYADPRHWAGYVCFGT